MSRLYVNARMLKPVSETHIRTLPIVGRWCISCSKVPALPCLIHIGHIRIQRTDCGIRRIPIPIRNAPSLTSFKDRIKTT